MANYGNTASNNWYFVRNVSSGTMTNSVFRCANSGYWLIAGHTTDFGGHKAHRMIASTEGMERSGQLFAPKKSSGQKL